MRNFLIKVFIFSIFPLATLYGVFLLEDGKVDPFYQRFTSGKKTALILGNSKAAQGIVPAVLDKKLFPEFGAKIYNYSFTVYNSPYGPVYLESLKNKLDEKAKDGYFVVTVDPWSISSDINEPNNIEKFEENDRFLATITEVNSDPNLKYLLTWFSKSYYEILLMRFKINLSKLHDDGWFETIGDIEAKSAVERRKFKVEYYNEYLKKYSFSEERFKYLQKTVELLRKNGPVFLVRMPLHSDILEIEDKVDPQFNSRMDSLSNRFGAPYFDFNDSDAQWEFKDGLHLTVESASDFSEALAEKIFMSNNRNK